MASCIPASCILHPLHPLHPASGFSLSGSDFAFALHSHAFLGGHQAVPSVLRVGSYRFFFYSADGQEPPHIHIARDRAKAKFWLEPVAFASASGFSARELLDIQSLIVAHQTLLSKAWYDCFGSAR